MYVKYSSEYGSGHLEVPWPAGTLSVSASPIGKLFSDRSRRFPINRGGGSFGTFFLGGGTEEGGEGRGGGRVTPKPEAQVARFLVGMFRNRFLEAGVDAKVSPKVGVNTKVSPKRGGGG
jgi:hypothetical protein